MQRTLAFCLLLPFAGAALAASPPATDSAQSAASEAADQHRMAALQTRMNELAREMAALSTKLGDQANATALHYLADNRRGMFGMAVTSADNGLRVGAVTPGGPAERAGIKAGDTITRIDGKPVGSHAGASESALWHAQAGKPIALVVDRDGKLRELHVTPERLQASDWQDIARQAQLAAGEATAQVRSPEFQKQIQQSIEDAMKGAEAARAGADMARTQAEAAREGALAAREAAGRARERAWIAVRSVPWFGLNLAPLNPGLGSYFGTDRGALVLSRDDEQFPELQPGDVITAVDGQSVARPEDATRALRDAAKSKSARVALRRHGKPVTLTMKVPGGWDILPAPPPPPPVPPVLSVPPIPSAPSVAPPAPPPPAPPSHA
jgi:S1-C subfamily serine protease